MFAKVLKTKTCTGRRRCRLVHAGEKHPAREHQCATRLVPLTVRMRTRSPTRKISPSETAWT